MPATTDDAVFDFEGNMEQSFYDFILVNGIELATANDPQRLGDDFVGVQFSVGGLAEDQHMSEKPDGSLEFDHYNFSVSITVHTDRVENAVPSASFSRYHREIVAKLRNLLSISRAAQVASLNDQITLYWINSMISSGTDYTAFDSGSDETSLAYEGTFSILTSAWPAV